MVDINFKQLFPTPFGFANLGEDARELNQILVQNIDEERKKFQPETETRTFAKNECGWQSKVGLEEFYTSFAKLRDAITSCVIPILIKSGYTKEYAGTLVVKQLWANVLFKAGGFSEPHIHGSGNTLWSGVYYPKSNDKNLDHFDVDKYIVGNGGASGSLVLRDPAFVNKSLIKTKKINTIKTTVDNQYYGGSIYITPRESLLILFPAWLEHYVQPVTDNIKRYSISFTI